MRGSDQLLCGVQVRASSLESLILSPFELAVATTKTNKTVYGDIEISKGFSYVINFPKYQIFSAGRVVSWNFLPPLV